MSVNLAQISAQIVANLRVTDPDLDTSVGTTTRKIIDAVSEQIAESYIDNHVVAYQYDIDSKSNAELDDFVQMFGMARQPAKRSSGTVTFVRSSNLSNAVTIPMGTTVSTTSGTIVTVQTIAPTILGIGVTTVTVPAQAVLAGASGNVGANTVTGGPAVSGATSWTNMIAFSGGADQETDLQLRARWKTTVFRSLAGTEQMYLGVANDDPACFNAIVVGSTTEWNEQVQVVGTTATSSITSSIASYVFSTPVFVGLPDLSSASNLLIPGVDYTFNNTVPPTLTILNTTKVPNGTVLTLDFQYEPTASRNFVTTGVTNRVDLWCAGSRAQAATQTVSFATAQKFTGTTTDTLYNQNFIGIDWHTPAVGNIFVSLAFGPILSVPSTMVINGVTYAQASAQNPMGTCTGYGTPSAVYYAYEIVHQVAPFGFTPTSLFGVEWFTGYYTGTGVPANTAQVPPNAFLVTFDGASGYSYNKMITDIDVGVQHWRMLGVDAKTHQAQAVQLLLNVAVVYTQGVSQEVAQANMYSAVAGVLQRVDFDGTLKISDLLQAMRGVVGVDNVRFLHGTDFTAYVATNPNGYSVAIQQVVDQTYNSTNNQYTPVILKSFVDSPGVNSTGRPVDIIFNNYQYPVLYGINVVAMAPNTFGVG